MDRNGNDHGENSNRSKRGVKRGRDEGSKHTRYREDQIVILEKAYEICPKPNRSQREEILREQPLLDDIDSNQLKVWFQNRRSREKQRKESGEIEELNKKLAAENKLLTEENTSLQKKLTSNPSSSYLGQEPGAVSPHLFFTDNNQRLLSLAEDAKNEFLSKAIGNAIKWIPVPGLKLPNPSSSSAICVSYSCIGVAARACTTVPFDPLKTIEILKDRPSWCRDCRRMDIIANYPGKNGGNIDLIYTQFYAPTTLACGRDFWTLRYTCVLEDGSFVVCEKSVSASDAAVLPRSPDELQFVRGTMLASGFLIRPSEGGSTLHLVGHFDFEESFVPEAVLPLYVSSELMAEKMIVPALYHIEHLANEMNNKKPYSYYDNDPDFMRRLSRRLIRGYNDAINGFAEDGWSLMSDGATDSLIISVKPNNEANALFDNVICVKSSLILQNISTSRVIKILQESRPAWMDFTFPDNPTASSRAALLEYPGLNTHDLSEKPVKLGQTNYGDEVVEVLRFKRIPHRQYSSKELHHMQIHNGMEDSRIGSCSELIFASIGGKKPDDSVLLCSGFRAFSLGSNEVTLSATETSIIPLTMLILAFQFPLENTFQEDAIVMAKEYVHRVIDFLDTVSVGQMQFASNFTLFGNNETMDLGLLGNSEPNPTFDLAFWICQSYRISLGVEMLGFNCLNTNTLSELIQNHPYPIMCFSLQPPLFCVFCNQSALNMVQTAPASMQFFSVDQILEGSNNVTLDSVLPTIIQEGYAILPPGFFRSLIGNFVRYEQGVVWTVHTPVDSVQYLALAIINWSFV